MYSFSIYTTEIVPIYSNRLFTYILVAYPIVKRQSNQYSKTEAKIKRSSLRLSRETCLIDCVVLVGPRVVIPRTPPRSESMLSMGT